MPPHPGQRDSVVWTHLTSNCCCVTWDPGRWKWGFSFVQQICVEHPSKEQERPSFSNNQSRRLENITDFFPKPQFSSSSKWGCYTSHWVFVKIKWHYVVKHLALCLRNNKFSINMSYYILLTSFSCWTWTFISLYPLLYSSTVSLYIVSIEENILINYREAAPCVEKKRPNLRNKMHRLSSSLCFQFSVWP